MGIFVELEWVIETNQFDVKKLQAFPLVAKLQLGNAQFELCPPNREIYASFQALPGGRNQSTQKNSDYRARLSPAFEYAA